MTAPDSSMISTSVAKLPLSAAAIATINGPDIYSDGMGILHAVLTLANKVGLATVSLKVQGKKLSDGTYYDLFTVAAAAAANGTFVYQLSPHAVSTAAGVTESKILVLPAVWRIVLLFGGTTGAGNSYDVTLDADMIPAN